MYSSGLKPLTSPAILVSKLVVSKWVMRPMPETPSTMFDQTVSRSLPIGVMKPMPVTATRRPFELDAMTQGYGRQGLFTLAPDVKTGHQVWTPSPEPRPKVACEDPKPAASAIGLEGCPGRPRGARAACPAGKARCGDAG